MTGGAWVLLAVAGAFAVLDWVAVARGDKRLEYIAKPATLVALIGVALALDPDDGAVRAWFVVALVCSLAGDVFLMLPRDLFVAGLASFLLGHVAYIVGLSIAASTGVWLVAGVAFVIAYVAVVGRQVVGAVAARHRDLLAPVAVYMLAISAMVATAFATEEPAAIVGALLFYVSDSLIAWNRFVEPMGWAAVAIMVTYHLGQAGLVLSLT